MADRSYETNPISWCFYIAAAIVVYCGWQEMRETPGFDWDIALRTAFMSTFLSAIGAGITWLDKRLIQRRRDKKAAKILKMLRKNPGQAPRARYLVYLRPFFTTGHLGIKNKRKFSSIPILPMYHAKNAESELEDIEAILVRAFEPLGLLVAIGKPGEQFGSGRIPSDDHTWKVDVERLVRHAQMVIVIPSERPGTAWEINFLRNKGYLYKCVFMMPPETYLKTINIEAAWKRADAHLKNQRFKLPDYEPTGLLFCMKPGRVKAKRTLHLDSHQKLLKNCLELICNGV